MKIKFLALIAFTSVVFFSAFTTRDTKDDLLNFIKKDYVSSTNSDELKSVMEHNFTDLFEKVLKIDVHENQNNLYYYAVYGSKDNKDVVELFKISKENIDNESFPLMKKSEIYGGDPYCYWQIQQERCGYEPDYISIRCGLTSKGCLSF